MLCRCSGVMENRISPSDKDERVRGYCAYDWGKSAFETSVTTAIFPAWFAYLFMEANGISMKLLGSEWTADAMFSAAVMIGALFVAICAPSLGVIADRRMIKMWWLRVLTILGSVSCILLALVSVSRCIHWLDMGHDYVHGSQRRVERRWSVLQRIAPSHGR